MCAVERRPSFWRQRPAALALVLILAGVLCAVVIVEVGVRASSGNWTDSFLERNRGLLKSSYPVSYDP